MHICKHFNSLSNNIIQIIKAGTVGECMFFIASGSVCVTTANGQELCHLEDGDYFGEIAFVLKNRKVRREFILKKLIDHKFDRQQIKLYNLFYSFFLNQRIVNVQAIEYCEIYILDYVNLKTFVQMNETIKQRLAESADGRMEHTLKGEELFRKRMDKKIDFPFGKEEEDN
jgi:CRP-like cAMP-binding protein